MKCEVEIHHSELARILVENIRYLSSLLLHEIEKNIRMELINRNFYELMEKNKKC